MAKRNAESTAKNSGKKKARGTPFAKGNPYRWKPGESGNPKGRPTSNDDLRATVQEILHSPSKRDAGITRLQDLILKMLESRSPADRAQILERAFGKVKDEQEHSGNIVLRVVYADESGDGITPSEQSDHA